MFKGIGNIASLMRQAQQVTGQMQSMNEQLKEQRARGSAGGGLVEVEVNGLGEILSLSIDPSLMEKGDREMIEDLVPAAANQAVAKAKQLHADAMRDMASGLQVPGLDEALAKFTGGMPEADGGVPETEPPENK